MLGSVTMIGGDHGKNVKNIFWTYDHIEIFSRIAKYQSRIESRAKFHYGTENFDRLPCQKIFFVFFPWYPPIIRLIPRIGSKISYFRQIFFFIV